MTDPRIEQKAREVVSKLEQDGWVEPGSAGINVCWAIAAALQSAVAEEREESKRLAEYLEKAVYAIRTNIGHHKPMEINPPFSTMPSGYYQSLPCTEDCPMCKIDKWIREAEAAIRARGQKETA